MPIPQATREMVRIRAADFGGPTWSNGAEKVTWTPAMKALYRKYQGRVDLHG